MLLFPALIQSQAIKIYSQTPIPLELSLPLSLASLTGASRKGGSERSKEGWN